MAASWRGRPRTSGGDAATTLFTPALDLGILAGVTRAWRARDWPATAGYRTEEGWYPLADLATADEAFTSSSIRELMPIVRLDDRLHRRRAAGPGGPDPPGGAPRGCRRLSRCTHPRITRPTRAAWVVIGARGGDPGQRS